MANKKLKVTYAEQATMIHIEGDPSNPEPIHHIVKFPGGEVEIARCSDNQTYWAHIVPHDDADIIDSRLMWTPETGHSIKEIKDEQNLKQVAVRFNGAYKEYPQDPYIRFKEPKQGCPNCGSKNCRSMGVEYWGDGTTTHLFDCNDCECEFTEDYSLVSVKKL